MTVTDDYIIEKLKKYLETQDDQDSKKIYVGLERLSIRELCEHLEKRTKIGNGLIELSKDLIKDVGENKWEKMLSF